MSHYKSNVRDIDFNLFEVLDREAILGTGPYADLDRETVSAILAEVDHLATTKLAESFAEGDRVPPVFDARDPHRHAAGGLQEVLPRADRLRRLAARAAGGAGRAGHPAVGAVGGQRAEHRRQPGRLHLRRRAEVRLRAVARGTERDRKIAQIMIDRQWGATMVLTEPDAGSDVGAGRTRAIPQPDGTWHLEGVKRFITSAEHDLTENIVHLVLARPHGVDGVGGPGTKGLSLFVVPKFHFDLETGELTGERNGVFATNVEKKMGIKASTTCELTFGDGTSRREGWLLGEVHDGIAQMFQVIEHARMMVGTKAIATLSTGYLNALEYAKSRVQGADLTRAADKTAPRVTITHHPDVRRSLMTQKSFAEGLRALVLFTASVQDRVALARAEGSRRRGRRAAERPAAADRQGLRLGALLGAARHRVAADLRRLGLPDRLPDRAVRPRRQDRHPLRGHHRDPGPGPVLPQDRQGPGPGAAGPLRPDRRVAGLRRRQRPAQGGARAAAAGAGGRRRHRRER